MSENRDVQASNDIASPPREVPYIPAFLSPAVLCQHNSSKILYKRKFSNIEFINPLSVEVTLTSVAGEHVSTI